MAESCFGEPKCIIKSEREHLRNHCINKTFWDQIFLNNGKVLEILRVLNESTNIFLNIVHVFNYA